MQTGWGQNSTFGDGTDELQKVQLDVISHEKCKEYYDEDGKTIYTSQICGGSEGGDKVSSIWTLVTLKSFSNYWNINQDTCRGDRWDKATTQSIFRFQTLFQ